MDEYNKLVDAFNNLNIKDKRNEVTEELKELLAMCGLLMKEKGIAELPLLHQAMNDNELGTEDDFLNSTYAYLISVKENIGKYFGE